MTQKIVGAVVICLMGIALLMASCAPAAAPTTTPPVTPTAPPTTAPEVTPTATPAIEVPKYGGAFVDSISGTIGFDDAFSGPWFCYSMHLVNEDLLIGNWAKGPAGTGETDFGITTFIAKIETGCLAESWEIPDSETIIYHIRKGVRWHDKPPVNGRELVAEDVAFSINRIFKTPTAYAGENSFPGWFRSATATDKYTVVIKGVENEISATSLVFRSLSDLLKIVPPEVVKQYGDLRDWKSSCGTGAYVLRDYVSGSSMTFAKNPNYWMKDPLHPGNTLPYLDSVKFLIIADASTRLAALRTGKLDTLRGIGWEDGNQLLKANPELQWKQSLGSSVYAIYMRVDKPELPISNVNVRRALHMAVDFQSIKNDYYGGQAEILTWPMAPMFKDAYTPLNELPQSARELFEYHPDKAKQLLAEAGYPKGFKTEIVTTQSYVDILSVIKDYWAAIGVDLVLDVKDAGVWDSVGRAHTYKEMLMSYKGLGSADIFTDLRPGISGNYSIVNDPYINERWAKIKSWGTDDPVRNRLSKEITLYTLSEIVPYVQMPLPYYHTIWWPWVKNYHGETAIGYYDSPDFHKYIWIDEAMKREKMGGG